MASCADDGKNREKKCREYRDERLRPVGCQLLQLDSVPLGVKLIT
jgi:hypothetical protein